MVVLLYLISFEKKNNTQGQQEELKNILSFFWSKKNRVKTKVQSILFTSYFVGRIARK